MKSKQLLGIILVLTSLACTLPISLTLGSPEATSVIDTPQLSTETPMEVPEITVTEMINQPLEDLPAPVALLTDPGDLKGVNLYNIDGTFITELVLGQDLWLDLDTTVVGSDLAPEPSDTVVIFYEFGPSNLEKYHGPGNITSLANIPNLLRLISEPYQDVYVYSTINMQQNGVQNDLYWTESYSFDTPVHEISEFESRGDGIFPLGVRSGEGNVDIWYTHMPYGIGGDIVFPPYSGLHYYRTGGDSNDVILVDDARPSGLSASKHWLAYSAPLSEATTLYIQNLESDENHLIALRADSTRGAGYVEFSPGDLYIAWMEGSGWMMSETPDFYSTVRVARINGEILAEKQASELGAAIGKESNWARPVAWLDDQTLLVQVHGMEWSDTAILKWDITTNVIQYYVTGAFIDFVYPPQ
jgi:hypothetical protein